MSSVRESLPDVSGLVGETVRLWPYTPELYPPDTLVQLWRLLQADHAASKVFWARTADPASDPAPVPFFMAFMAQVILLIPQDLATGEVMGFCWFDDIVFGHRAAFNMFYRRHWWGHSAREATALAMGYGHTVMGWPTLWGLTPWALAVQHGLALGWDHLAVLPGYACIHGRPHDVHILRHGA